MKYKLNIFIALLLSSIFFTSCSSEENTENDLQSDSVIEINNDTLRINAINNNTEDTLNIENSEKKTVNVSKYICPLGDKDGNSITEGICPICEMELIENPDYIDSK